jgi:hypothetical protein
MESGQPLINQFRDSAKDMGENVQDMAENTGKTISENISNISNNVKESLNDFSQKSIVDAGSDFLDSNSLLAKFVFILFVLFGFMFLLNIGMRIIGLFTKSGKNPMLVKGKLSGSDGIEISQNPKNADGKTIYRSNNKSSGAEFTWSTWLYLDKADADSGKYKHIFSKGKGKRKTISGDNDEHVKVANGPGLYVEVDSSGAQHLQLYMDKIDNNSETITVNNVPIAKWFHLAIRLQNKVVDVYVNGVVSKRKEMSHLPKQNYHNIAVGGGNSGGGFAGSISNLQYYAHAMNVFEINNVVMKGPNTNTSDLSSDAQGKSGNYSYLSNTWYKSG